MHVKKVSSKGWFDGKAQALLCSGLAHASADIQSDWASL
jgi:hypothetical protein